MSGTRKKTFRCKQGLSCPILSLIAVPFLSQPDNMVDAKVYFKPAFLLTVSPAHFALYSDLTHTCTTIQRDSGAISTAHVQDSQSRGLECFGALGLAKLHTSKYLLIISEATFIGNLKDAKVFRVDKCAYFPYKGSPSAADKRYLAMYDEVISTKSLYFSYSYDLTHTVQRMSEFSAQVKAQHLVLRAEYRFFWNFAFAEELIAAKALDVVVPVISGYVRIEEANFSGNELDFALISRRDHRRAGVRFQTRGLDASGNSANFAETEQLLFVHSRGSFVTCSFVQIRGSIPLRWQQKPNLKWEPEGVVVGNAQVNMEAAEKHFTEIVSCYGDVFLINLIDKKKTQEKMGSALKSQIETLKNPRVRLTWFDFHHECRAMHWENISKLVREVNSFLDSYSFYQSTMDANGTWGQETVNQHQNGVFRTNCMDCLDRTNVVQSVLARNLLHRQLHALGLAGKPTGEAFQPLPAGLETCFRLFWADNADIISVLYAGTGALKVDFTRTGKRTKQGALDDGKKSLQRYIINNFYDGTRKNAIDVFLGKITPASQQQPSPFRHFAMGKMLATALICMFLVHVAGKATGESWLAYLLGVLLGTVMLQKILTVNGRSWIDKPVLDT